MKRHARKVRKTACQRSHCPMANVLDMLGDKWTLLVVRDLIFMGKRLYSELIQSPEGLPSNILADRLKRLEKAGLVTKKPYQRHPVRYEYHVTAQARDLIPVFKAMARWANKYLPGTATPPPGFFEKFEKQ